MLNGRVTPAYVWVLTQRFLILGSQQQFHFNSRLSFGQTQTPNLSHNSISLSVLRLTPLNTLYDALEDALEIYEVTHSFSAFWCYFDIYFSEPSMGSTFKGTQKRKCLDFASKFFISLLLA